MCLQNIYTSTNTQILDCVCESAFIPASIFITMQRITFLFTMKSNIMEEIHIPLALSYVQIIF